MRPFAKSFAGIPSRTKRSFAAEADINNIMRRYARTGVLPVRAGKPLYADVSAVEDFFQAKQTLMMAEEKFLSLPPGLRARFRNDAAQLLSFLADPRNVDEARKLGLLGAEVGSKAEPNELGVVPGTATAGSKDQGKP